MPASNILVVNNHAVGRDALVALLNDEGFAVAAYASAADCLADCDFRHVACAVVSHAMPEMTGLELAKAFQAGWLAIPTILLADEDPAGPKDRAEAGVIAVLGLPPDRVALFGLLHKALAVKRSQATA